MKRFRYIGISIGAALLLLLFTLPGAAQDVPSGTLTVVGFGVGDEIASTRVDRFHEQYPGVEITFTEGALDRQQFLTAVASGAPSDLIYIDRDTLSTYALRGAIQPLTECIAARSIDMSQFRPAAVAQVTVDGVVYGVPEFFTVVLLMANNAALSEAGLTADALDTREWASITALNDALTRMQDGAVTRIGFDPKLPEFFPLWASASGVQLLSEDGRTAQINTPEAVAVLEYAAGLHDAAGGRQAFTAFRDTWDFFGAGNQIAADQLGVFPMEQWYVNVLASASPDANVIFAPFRDVQGEPISIATGNAWAIPTGAANPDAACAFIQSMTSTDSWVAAAQARADLRASDGAFNAGVFTANRDADAIIFSEIVQPDTSTAYGSAIETILDLQERAVTIAPNPAGAEFRQAWLDAVNRVLNGEQDARTALDQAQQEAQTALDEAWGQIG